MGTHPIFESDFDCLTDCEKITMSANQYSYKGDPLASIGIQFCQECNNMLYPKEDKVNKILLYQCRNCDFCTEAERPCIYVNKLISNENELLQINPDVIEDPTLPRTNTVNCPKCGFSSACYFQSYSTMKDARMNLFYVCRSCRFEWTTEEH